MPESRILRSMEQLRTFTKSRIAPTPSGFLHLGNVFSFALTAGLAKRAGAGILLRIDDLDQERVNEHYVRDIFDTLHFLGIPWSEGPRDYTDYRTTWSQLHRMPLYEQALEQLKAHVFACDCSRAQISRLSAAGAYPGTCRHKNLPLNTPGTAWRLRTDGAQELQMQTLSGNTVTAALPAIMQDFVVRKKDGYPAYQLSSVIDDGHFAIDGVVRGEDLRASTLAQLYLCRLLPGSRFADTVFYHHPLLLEPSAQKMSKSAGATSVQFLRKEGKTKSDIFRMAARMAGMEAPVRSFEELTDALVAQPRN